MYTNPRPGQYLTQTHSHFTRAVAATDSCFALIGAHQRAKAVGLKNGENPCLKNLLLPRRVQSSQSSWLGAAQRFYCNMRGEGGSRVTNTLTKGANIHQPTAWTLSHACAEPYHAGSGSHG